MKRESKGTVEDCLNIDSRTMARSNTFVDGASGIWGWKQDNEISSSMSYEYRHGALILSFIQNGANHCLHIGVTTTPCNYGNHRYWFICPDNDCSNRVAKLYLVDGKFKCRKCQKLNYLIQQCNKEHVARINMQRMRIKLGWPLDREAIPFFRRVYKPLNKNKKTFQAMVEKHDMYERKANAAAIAFHNAFMDKIEKFIEK
jgi:hypothetical protein